MCFLAAYPADVDVNPGHLWEAAATNRDGSGWAIVHGRKMITGRSMSPEQAVEEFDLARAKYRGEAVFHHRYGTHGTMSLDNVHPFRVGKRKDTLLAHNGILPSLTQPLKGDPRSDTRKFSQTVLPTLWGARNGRVNWDDAETVASIGEWIGTWNKLTVLTVDPTLSAHLYIVNERSGAWVHESGRTGTPQESAWYSNTDWIPYVPPVRATLTTGLGDTWSADGTYLGRWAEADPSCPWCGAVAELDATECTYCHGCYECGDDYELCACRDRTDPADHDSPSDRAETEAWLAEYENRI